MAQSQQRTNKVPANSEALLVRGAPPEECFVLIHGGDLGRRLPLVSDGVLGRDPDSAMCLDLPDVSRQHARLTKSDKSWSIVDLKSTNGTEVNGAPATKATVLRNGDLIRLGRVILKFIVGGNVEALFHQELYRATIIDALTQAANKRHLLETLDREIARASRYRRVLAMAMIDIDHFKTLNDRHGHLIGDGVLRQVGTQLSIGLRKEELLARFGGDEFTLVLPELTVKKASILCEKLRARVEKEPFTAGDVPIYVTVSIGIAKWAPLMGVDDLIRAADERLYRAKSGGRNRVVAD